jgi:maltose/maltodextrin transport system permease protein
MPMVHPKSTRYQLIAAHAGLIAFIAVVTFPLLMIIAISFREGNLAVGSLLPSHPTLEHWSLAFGIPFERADGTVIQPPFPVLRWLMNSVKIALVSSALIVLLSMTGAYAFARLRFTGRTALLNGILLTQVFPATLALVAYFVIFDKLGHIVPGFGVDSHLSVIIANLGLICLHIWTIKGYYDTIDPAMEEAAVMDGASRWQAYRHILLPMSVPILAVVFILAFIGTIIEYPVASVLLQTENQLTLAVGSRMYLYEQNYLWGDFAAAAVLSGIPITVVFLLAQKWLVSGLSEGSVKG